MPKSRHRKNHKKKVAARRKRLEEKRRAFTKKFREQFNEEMLKEIDGDDEVIDYVLNKFN